MSGWEEALMFARVTVKKDDLAKEPSMEWKQRMLRAEHSVIRRVIIDFVLTDVPYWVAMQLVRHNVGVTSFVSTQRTDRTGEDRNKKPQDALVNLGMTLNAQSLINISKERLCRKASKETRLVWARLVSSIVEVAPEFEGICKSKCLYRGFCPEAKVVGEVACWEGK